jgi:hypothetical protein
LGGAARPSGPKSRDHGGGRLLACAKSPYFTEAVLTLDTLDVVLALLAGSAFLDNWRLRRQRCEPKPELRDDPVHVLDGDVVMPVPDDPRWKTVREPIESEEWDGRRWRRIARKSDGFRLGDVFITIAEEDVFVGDQEVKRTKRTRAYARAVRTAYVQTKALYSLENG